MELTLQLEKMSTEEKIKAMEIIWDDFCKKADSKPSPPWHEEVLHDREQVVKNGDEEFVNWEKAKKTIREVIS